MSMATYHKAQLQVVGYRAIPSRVNAALSSHDLNTSQWIILGWLHDNAGGLRVSKLAEVLDVETPLITALVQPLRERQLVRQHTDPTDGRAKLVQLTAAGSQLVKKLEDELQAKLQVFEKAVTPAHMQQYFDALQRFIDASR